jgi:hypothetical protein
VAADVPQGKRFSHVYLARGEPTQDSARMRRRIASEIGAFGALGRNEDFSRFIERKLGIASPLSSADSWIGLLAKWELKDVLDLVTFASGFLERNSLSPRPWVERIREIFVEENVHYTVDDRGGVHRKYDEEFACNTAAAIAALQAPRYANARDNYEKSLEALSDALPDFKTAIRANFAAVEVVFRLLLSSAPRLASGQVQSLVPLVQKALASDPVAQSASTRMLDAFKDWIDAAHVYRHEQGREEPTQPPIPLAISILSVGATYLRWLAETDAALQTPK